MNKLITMCLILLSFTYSRGNALYHLQRYEEALTSYEQALRLGYHMTEIYYDQGNTLYHLRRYGEAVDAYQQAILLKPTFAVAYYDLGNALYHLHRYEEAVDAYEKSIDLEPERAVAYYDLGNALYQTQRYNDAVAAYKKGIGLEPERVVAYYDLGNALYQLGRVEEAIDAYSQATQYGYHTAAVYYGKGQALCTLKRYEEALTSYEEGLLLASDDPALLSAKAEVIKRIEQATILRRKKSLFGYETDGGRKSLLWNNPEVALSSEKYEAWDKTRRNFNREEILDGIWLKISDTGNYYKVRLLPHGRLVKCALFDANNHGEGSWSLLDGVLRITIGWYTLDVFANYEGTKHSGIEFYKKEQTPDAYFTMLHVPGLNTKRWDDMSEIIKIVHQVYERILGRRADEVGLITYGGVLYRGERSVREILRILGKSPEYKQQFIDPFVDAGQVEVAWSLL